MAGTVEYTPLCLLYAQATSSPITVGNSWSNFVVLNIVVLLVKAGSAESLDRTQLPGLEMYQDAEDGAMYAHGF